MRVGLNLLYLIPGVVGGTETYARSLLHALGEIDASNEYFVFLNKESSGLEIPGRGNFRRIQTPVRATSRGTRYVWEQLVLPASICNLGLDVVHSLGYVGPVAASIPSIVTIHDTNFIALRDSLPVFKRTFLDVFVRLSARFSSHVITDSEFSKREIRGALGLRGDKITVVHLAAGKPYEKRRNEPMTDSRGVRQPYFVAFAGSSSHKNIPRMLRAFATIRKSVPHDLVLIGRITPDGEIRRAIAELGIDSRVRLPGYVAADQADDLLSGAHLLVLPSLYEGFGLPVLEAQDLGVPVACSRAASLPEIAGEGAAYFDPHSVESIASVVRDCLINSDKLRSLAAGGRRNLERFSWAKAAKETIGVYLRTARAHHGKS